MCEASQDFADLGTKCNAVSGMSEKMSDQTVQLQGLIAFFKVNGAENSAPVTHLTAHKTATYKPSLNKPAPKPVLAATGGGFVKF